uniref:Uncharacterized protein n=1 Tax=Streptomyces sp. NBC_01393 TaxID=2903851 RepID=A0AAU3IA88_9ACTN
MSSVCNKADAPQLDASSVTRIYDRVDAPIATGSAHFMRAGSELHLVHSDLELNDTRQAAVRVACAVAALDAALDEYETSHQVAKELGFYRLHDDRLREANSGEFRIRETLREAGNLGLLYLDEASAERTSRIFEEGGDEAAFTNFIAELRLLLEGLRAFDASAADENPVYWQHFGWKSITAFDQLRIYGQSLAVINIFGMTREPSSSVVS